jgi:hypothetical protein
MNSRHVLKSERLRSNGWTLLLKCINVKGEIDADLPQVQLFLDRCERTFKSDYSYFRNGLLIHHSGRRGLCVSLWHHGRWGDMDEVFFYGEYIFHGKSEFQILEVGDPFICIHEIELLNDYLSSVVAGSNSPL